MIILILIILLSLSLLTFLFFNKSIKQSIINKNKEVQKLDKEIDDLSTTLHRTLDSLKNIENEINTNIETKNTLEQEISNKETQIKMQQEHLDALNKNLKIQKDTSKEAFENWFDVLYKDYSDKKVEYETLVNNLNEAYSNQQNKILSEIEKTRKELDSIKHTRDAAIEAARLDKKIQENLSDYCLTLSQSDIEDIHRLEEVKKLLHNKRVLSMLIWQTYISKPFKTLIAKILNNSSPVIGIYKITNTITGESYIGQSVNISDRFCEHAKCGLGIDTPAGNKLYKSMQEYGIQNFSWQVIEKCKREELNEKEKFFINLYNAVEFGLNSSKGISK